MSDKVKMPTEANPEEWAKYILSLAAVDEFMLTKLLEAFKHQVTQPIDENAELLRKLTEQQKQLTDALAKGN